MEFQFNGNYLLPMEEPEQRSKLCFADKQLATFFKVELNDFMLRSIKQTYGDKLAALDGNIGQVRDFYFDDQTWMVRYLVVDTGSWLPGRQVLLAPHAFNQLQLEEKLLIVNLTRKQIEDSPVMNTHQPLSRQYEMEYYRHYGWPNYWDGGGLAGLNSFPTLERPATATPGGHDPALVRADAHLRSTQAVNGYRIEGSDGFIGHLNDFLMNPQSWAIQQLVIKTGHLLLGREVLVPVGLVDCISYDESTVHIRLTRDAADQSPEHILNQTLTEAVGQQTLQKPELTL